ncbi:hypothetical protein DM01DRAFT_159219 [Hesseltinella vesiculosa]|uniref:Uncharacterized protein n=1 Tax=Hesseltinella vesiculosa TaxID=101127 RepID=A0A1X2GVE0_9FUNG|nr:hypothetical protein DM01DRAFT_159219 [Hesseltinella vesiculosa]
MLHDFFSCSMTFFCSMIFIQTCSMIFSCFMIYIHAPWLFLKLHESERERNPLPFGGGMCSSFWWHGDLFVKHNKARKKKHKYGWSPSFLFELQHGACATCLTF